MWRRPLCNRMFCPAIRHHFAHRICDVTMGKHLHVGMRVPHQRRLQQPLRLRLLRLHQYIRLTSPLPLQQPLRLPPPVRLHQPMRSRPPMTANRRSHKTKRRRHLLREHETTPAHCYRCWLVQFRVWVPQVRRSLTGLRNDLCAVPWCSPDSSRANISGT